MRRLSQDHDLVCKMYNYATTIARPAASINIARLVQNIEAVFAASFGIFPLTSDTELVVSLVPDCDPPVEVVVVPPEVVPVVPVGSNVAPYTRAY